MEGEADDATQKIVGGKVVKKTAKEMKADKEKEESGFPKGQKLAPITNEQWRDVLSRLRKLENEA